MLPQLAVVTGVARHSVGEAVVQALIERRESGRIVAIDKTSNPDLQSNAAVSEILIDLNPLNSPDGAVGLEKRLISSLRTTLVKAGVNGLDCLVQCAGAYDFGPFGDYGASRLARILGLNVLGTTAVLSAAVRLNEAMGRENGTSFSHVLIGSFQGLQVRSLRSVYASSKAFGIDLCSSLACGGELRKCIYLAPGYIDTPMLHRNHWMKAGGSDSLHDQTLAGSPEDYRSIFIGCDRAKLLALAGDLALDIDGLDVTMDRYAAERRKAQAGKLGVISAKQCAAVILDLLNSADVESGVYLVRSDPAGGRPIVEMACFEALDRWTLFKRESSAVVL